MCPAPCPSRGTSLQPSRLAHSSRVPAKIRAFAATCPSLCQKHTSTAPSTESVARKHQADARGAGDGDRRARHMSYGSHAWRWRLSPASFRDLQPSTAKWSVNGRRVGRHPGEGLMLPLRGGVREVEEWFVQAFSRINSTLTLILTLALSRPCSPSPSPSPRLHPRPRPTYVTLALTLTLA